MSIANVHPPARQDEFRAVLLQDELLAINIFIESTHSMLFFVVLLCTNKSELEIASRIL